MKNPAIHRYEIVRFYAPSPFFDKRPEIIKTQLTLEQAQSHCSGPSTRCEGEWFHGYRESKRKVPGLFQVSITRALVNCYP